MKIISEKTLDLYRGPGRCQFCGNSCSKREPHHLRAKGLGSGKRIDIPINLIALGSTPLFQCSCHTKIGDGNIKAANVLAIVAQRECTLSNTITEVMDFIIRLPKGMTEIAILNEVMELPPKLRRLALDQLAKAGVIP